MTDAIAQDMKNFSQIQNEVRLWREVERLENYNRKDNMRSFGVNENVHTVCYTVLIPDDLYKNIDT